MDKHFTASVYIVARINGLKKVLLHKHKKLNIWLPIGGHIEKGENQLEALIREVKEETNLDLILVSKQKLIKTPIVRELTLPIAILEENIPMYRNIRAHKHIDLIYVSRAKNPSKIRMKEQYRWVGLRDLYKAEIGKEVKYLAKKVLVLT